MICIPYIKIVRVDRDIYEIYKREPPYFEEVVNSKDGEIAEITSEMIQGRRFVNIHGEEVCIGLSKDVQKLLGLPFTVFENQTKEIEDLKSANKGLGLLISNINNELMKINNMSFRQRLVFLFTNS